MYELTNTSGVVDVFLQGLHLLKYQAAVQTDAMIFFCLKGATHYLSIIVDMEDLTSIISNSILELELHLLQLQYKIV